jgi:hypothetical protein
MCEEDEDDELPGNELSTTSVMSLHSNAVLTFPGFDVIYAFVCRVCGDGVDLKQRVQ